MRRRAALAFGATLAAGLSGCALAPPALDRADGAVLTGRLAVHVAASEGREERAVSAAFELQGSGEAGALNLVSPLGTMIAQARWAPGMVLLRTPQSEARYADLDELSREVLGESLPLAALFDWLRGRPWPGSESVATVPPEEAGFRQLEWVVSLARFDEAWVTARRDRPPSVTLRAKLDRP